MMNLRDELRTSADDVVSEFGFSATLTRQTGDTYDPNTGTVSTTESTFSVTAVFAGYVKEDEVGDGVERGDRKIYVSALDSTAPLEGDKISGGGEDAKIVRVWDVLRSDSGTSLYVCAARG